MKLVIRKGLGYVFYVMVLCFFLFFFTYSRFISIHILKTYWEFLSSQDSLIWRVGHPSPNLQSGCSNKFRTLSSLGTTPSASCHKVWLAPLLSSGVVHIKEPYLLERGVPRGVVVQGVGLEIKRLLVPTEPATPLKIPSSRRVFYDF